MVSVAEEKLINFDLEAGEVLLTWERGEAPWDDVAVDITAVKLLGRVGLDVDVVASEHWTVVLMAPYSFLYIFNIEHLPCVKREEEGLGVCCVLARVLPALRSEASKDPVAAVLDNCNCRSAVVTSAVEITSFESVFTRSIEKLSTCYVYRLKKAF